MFYESADIIEALFLSAAKTVPHNGKKALLNQISVMQRAFVDHCPLNINEKKQHFHIL